MSRSKIIISMPKVQVEFLLLTLYSKAGGKNILLLTSMLHNTNNYITDIDDIMEEFREATSCKTEHALGWY